MKLAAIVHVEDDSSWLAIIDTDLLPGYLSVIFEDAAESGDCTLPETVNTELHAATIDTRPITIDATIAVYIGDA